MLSAGLRGARASLHRAVGAAVSRSYPPVSQACITATQCSVQTPSRSSSILSSCHYPPGTMLTRRALSSKASSKAAALGKLFMERPCSLEVASEGPEDSHSENAPFLIKIALKMGGFYRCVAPHLFLPIYTRCGVLYVLAPLASKACSPRYRALHLSPRALNPRHRRRRLPTVRACTACEHTHPKYPTRINPRPWQPSDTLYPAPGIHLKPSSQPPPLLLARCRTSHRIEQHAVDQSARSRPAVCCHQRAGRGPGADGCAGD